MKHILMLLMTWMLAATAVAQIPRMMLDPWYREMKVNRKGVSEVQTEGMPKDSTAVSTEEEMTNVLTLMREAYNNKSWTEVDSLFEVAHNEVPDNMNIYNWERQSLRRQMTENNTPIETMHRLMNIYRQRFDAGLPEDVPYQYGENRQWNETQRLVDYATYAGRRIDNNTQFEFLNEGIKGLDRPLNAVVLCQLMDLTLADDLLGDEEYMHRYEQYVTAAHETRDWLNDNFLKMEVQTVSQLLQAMEQREQRMQRDSRAVHSMQVAQEAEREERLKNSDNPEERAQYLMLQASKHLANKEYEAAASAINEALALNRDNAVAYLRLAECYTANARVTGRVGNFLDKYSTQFATVAAIDMLRENLHQVQSQVGRSAMTTQIDQLRSFVNEHPIQRQDLFRISMGYGDVVRLQSYVKRTITLRERY